MLIWVLPYTLLYQGGLRGSNKYMDPWRTSGKEKWLQGRAHLMLPSRNFGTWYIASCMLCHGNMSGIVLIKNICTDYWHQQGNFRVVDFLFHLWLYKCADKIAEEYCTRFSASVTRFEDAPVIAEIRGKGNHVAWSRIEVCYHPTPALHLTWMWTLYSFWGLLAMITPALSNLVWMVEPVAPKCGNHFCQSKMKLVKATMSRIVSGSTLWQYSSWMLTMYIEGLLLGISTWRATMSRGYMAIILAGKFVTSSMKRNV